MQKITTKQITTTALLLAICIVSQYFKNISPYITGPIVNATIILAVLGVGLYSGIIISVIAPITAFFFTGSPIMASIPLMFPIVMAGNVILALFTCFFQVKFKFKYHLASGLMLGSIAKAVFMGIVVVLIVLPLFGHSIAANLPKPEALPAVLAAAKITFSVTQLITSITGSILACIIWLPLKKALKNDME